LTKLERLIVTFPPIAFVIRKSKSNSLPGLQKIPLYDVVAFLFKQFKKVGLNERAAAISYNLFMALPASLLFLFAIVPYLPEAINFKNHILDLFKNLTPNSSTYQFIKKLLDDLLQKHVGVFSFGFLLLMFYASNAMLGVIRSFDKSISEKKAYFMHKRWRAIKLTFILFLLVIGSVLILVGQEQLALLLKKIFQMKRKAKIPWWDSVRWVIIIGFIFYGIAFIYKFAPSVKKRWKLLSPGSILATTLTILTTFAFSYWVNHFASYNKVYGTIGTVLIIMLLIFINSLVLLIGFELNVSITYLHAEAEARKAKELMDGLVANKEDQTLASTNK
jgi:membrane protein